MYNEFYGFSEKPFEIVPDPRFLYLTLSHREALYAIMKGIESRQSFVSISGEVGTGKTTLIHSLLTSLDEKVKTAFIFHTLITFEELLEIIFGELNLDAAGKDKKTLLHHLDEYLSHIASDQAVAVIIDEAQHLSKEIMHEFGELFSMSPMASGRLLIVFVGQPELDNMLNSPDMKFLNQQIRIRYKMSTLTTEESQDYIEHRLKLVGSSLSEIFSAKAIHAITKYAKGIPRVINIVCDNALLYGFGKSEKKIDAKIIREVIKEMEGPSCRKLGPMRIFKFLKRMLPVSHEGLVSPRQIAVILLLPLSLGGTVLMMVGFLRYGDLNRQRIESIWTSLFRNEQHLVTTPQTATARTSKNVVHYPTVDTRALPGESSRPAVPSSASSIRIGKETRLTETIIVKKGQSIASLAEQYYGKTNTAIVDFILNANPEIANANLISVQQKIRMPKITEKSLIVQSSDRTYKINVGTFWSAEFAKLYKAEPSLKGKEIEVIARKATPKETWYRIFAGKFSDKDEALKVISILKDKDLLPLLRIPKPK